MLREFKIQHLVSGDTVIVHKQCEGVLAIAVHGTDLMELNNAAMRHRCPPLPLSPHQHCTQEGCQFSNSHTAEWCGSPQPRRCNCGFCYQSE